MKINLEEASGRFEEYWSPRIAGELNGRHVKSVKLKGEWTKA
jgi:hypothetical protein